MSFSRSTLSISGLDVEVVRKEIKNVHLSVMPPHGRVRLTAPENMTEDNARLAVITRWGWIKKKQKEYLSQRRETAREYVDGETHYFEGQKYLLSVMNTKGAAKVAVAGNGRIELRCRADANRQSKAKAFDNLYRRHLTDVLEKIVPSWCEALAVTPPAVRIQRMRTKWGSCNPQTRRIMINLELAKKPRRCVEYIVAHELAHLRVRYHNAEFVALLEKVMPDWRHHKEILNSLPLAHDEWVG